MCNKLDQRVDLCSLPRTLSLQPGLEVLHIRLGSLTFLYICCKSRIAEPCEHVTKLFRHPMQRFCQEIVSSWQRFAGRFFKGALELLEGQLVASQRQTLVCVKFLVLLKQRLCTEEANIACGNELQLLLCFQSQVETAGKHLAEEVWRKVIEEGDWAQNGPGHVVLFSLRDQVLLDVVFGDEVRDIGRIVV